MRTVRGLSNLCIENTDYILIEFPFVEKEIGWILEMVEILLYDHRLRPIIAHGERYLWLMKQPQLLYEMIQAGCLVQCNISSLLNGQNNMPKNFWNIIWYTFWAATVIIRKNGLRRWEWPCRREFPKKLFLLSAKTLWLYYKINARLLPS